MEERDIHDLAQLHMSSLTDSIVGALGRDYVMSFYRYVTRSDKEITVVERNHAGTIIAATVVSLQPPTLNRRLLLHTSLLSSFLKQAPRMLSLLWHGRRPVGGACASDATAVPSDVPEMILIFAAAAARGHGVGSALVQQVEQRLQQASVVQYQVRTVADPGNRALAFYRNRNFQPAGTSFKHGKCYQVFTRRLGAD
jgi:GNAT superfamily N-acetyltransferase